MINTTIFSPRVIVMRASVVEERTKGRIAKAEQRRFQTHLDPSERDSLCPSFSFARGVSSATRARRGSHAL